MAFIFYCLSTPALLIGWERVEELSDWLELDTSHCSVEISDVSETCCCSPRLRQDSSKQLDDMRDEKSSGLHLTPHWSNEPSGALWLADQVTRCQMGIRVSTPVQCWPQARGYRTPQQLPATGAQPLPHTLCPIVWAFYWQTHFITDLLDTQRKVPSNF